MNSITFINCNIIDGTGTLPYHGKVIVQNNRIQKILKNDSESNLLCEGLLIDCQGATLMPGLIEPHAHISFADTATLEAMGDIPVEEHTLITMKNAKTMLDHGFTTCVSAASAKPRLDVVIRNAIQQNEIPGPRLYANSPELTVTGGLGDVRRMHLLRETFSIVCNGPEEFRKVARELVREGVDLLKLNLSGDTFVLTARSTQTVMMEEEAKAVTQVAAAHGVKVAAHCRSVGSIQMAIRLGIDIIYHATYCDHATLDLLEAHKDHIFIAPTLGIQYSTIEKGGKFGIDAKQIEKMGCRVELESGINNMIELHRRGVRILPGGDYGFAWNPMGHNAKDLELFVKLLNFTPMQAIVAATKWGSEMISRQHELGLIKEGYLADLIVVEGDPLKDIKVLQNKERILVVMIDGKLHKPQLQKKFALPIIESSFKSNQIS